MIIFEVMAACHIAKVAELEKQCFSEPWSENSLLSELNNPLSLWVVALKNGEVIGYVGSQIVPDEADMMNLAVEESYRRLGVGDSLVEKLLELLQQRSVRSLTLEVRASNHAAISLYEKKGFTQVGCRPSYYRKPKEDALILRKEWEL